MEAKTRGDKTLDLTKTVYELCADDPDIPAILAEAGFRDIVRPGMIGTAGRFMTLPKGAAFKGIDLETVRQVFWAHGYEIREGRA